MAGLISLPRCLRHAVRRGRDRVFQVESRAHLAATVTANRGLTPTPAPAGALARLSPRPATDQRPPSRGLRSACRICCSVIALVGAAGRWAALAASHRWIACSRGVVLQRCRASRPAAVRSHRRRAPVRTAVRRHRPVAAHPFGCTTRRGQERYLRPITVKDYR